VIYCSHVINSIDVFQSGDVVELREQAGGGTWFKPVFDYVRRELNNECSGLVYFTDLECPHDYDISAITYPVLWASTCPTNEYNTPPVGEVLVVIPD